jgi:hypothetical protein
MVGDSVPYSRHRKSAKHTRERMHVVPLCTTCNLNAGEWFCTHCAALICERCPCSCCPDCDRIIEDEPLPDYCPHCGAYLIDGPDPRAKRANRRR